MFRPDRQDVSFSLRLSRGDRAFLAELQRELQLATVAAAVRRLVASARGCFGLPPYIACRLREDAQGRGLHFLAYVQELLAQQYERLVRAEEGR